MQNKTEPTCPSRRMTKDPSSVQTKQLFLTPVDMTPDMMQELEDLHLIRRLYPHRDDLSVEKGEALGASVYEPQEGYGPHKLISVTVDREAFAGFGVHPDNEEFWLIGDPCCKPLFLAVAKMPRKALEAKIAADSLTNDDFVLLRVKYNDPYVSCFVMLADIPHGEAVTEAQRQPPTFYVTESRDLPLELTDLGGWQLCVGS